MAIELTEVTGYAALARDAQGSAIVAAHPRMRVMDIAAAYTCDYTVDDIQADFAFLSLEEIHQSIAYYLTHKEEIHREFDQHARSWMAEQPRG